MAVALHANRLFRKFPNNRRCGSETEIKSYTSCVDHRSWSLNHKLKSKYIADIVQGFHQHEIRNVISNNISEISFNKTFYQDFHVDECGAGGDDNTPFHSARTEIEPTEYDANELESMPREHLIALQIQQYEKEKVIFINSDIKNSIYTNIANRITSKQ